MKNKTVIISIVLVLLVAGAGAFYLLTRDGGNKDTASNNRTNIAVNSSEDEIDVRKVVWDQLPQEQKDRIVGTWQDGKVNTLTLGEGAFMSDGEKIVEIEGYAGKEIYVIELPTDYINNSHNMIIYADTTTHDLLGYGLID